MANAATWKRRLAEWRSSGLTAERFAAGRDFAPSTLKWWSSHLRRAEGRGRTPSPATPPAASGPAVAAPEERLPNGVPLVRVIRAPGPAPAPLTEVPVVVEHGTVRVVLRGGFERATLEAVLDALDARAARAGGRS